MFSPRAPSVFLFSLVMLAVISGCRFMSAPKAADGEIRGRVVVSESPTVVTPVEGAAVLLEGVGRVVLTNAEGRFSLRPVPAGSWTLRIRKSTQAGELAVRVDGIQLALDLEGTGVADVGDVTLGGLGEWNGQVLRAGAGVSGARVVMDRVGESATDATGGFRFDGLSPGRYEVSVVLPQGEGVVRMPALVVPLSAKLDTALVLDRLVPDKTGDGAGYALLEGRTDHSGIRVKVEGLPSGTPAVSAETNATGAYMLGQVQAGVYSLIASAEGFRTAQVPFTVVAGRTQVPAMLLVPQGSPCGGAGAPGDEDGDGAQDDGEPVTCRCSPGTVDADGDGLCDHADRDVDADAVDNAVDNCPSAANPSQEDADGDGRGDACDDPVTCSDGASNAAETDVDCGGGACAPCADGLACAGAADCASGVCTGGSCQAASCTDGVRNGLEVAADCGGGV